MAFAGILGCGEVPPTLPPPLPAPADVVPAPGDAARGAALLADRGLGRSGFACTDCHRVEAGGPPRPAPALVGVADAGPFWSGATSRLGEAANRCVERYLSRPSLGAQALGDVVASMRARSPGVARVADEGGALYDDACRHCHEEGPADAVAGCAWRRVDLRRALRGEGRAPHPASFMPAFPPERLEARALQTLTAWLLDPPEGVSCRVGNARDE